MEAERTPPWKPHCQAKARDRGVKLESSRGSSSSVVLESLRPAKERKETVALDARDVPAVATDDLATQLSQIAEQRRVVLCLHQFTEYGRLRQIGKHQG